MNSSSINTMVISAKNEIGQQIRFIDKSIKDLDYRMTRIEKLLQQIIKNQEQQKY